LKKIKILITTKLSNKKLKDKLTPITESESVSAIEIVRAHPGEKLKKARYSSLPKKRSNNLFLEIPSIFFYLLNRIIVNKPDLLVGIYYVPYGYFVQLLGKIFRIPYVCNLIGSDLSLYKSMPNHWKVLKKIMCRCNFLTTTGNSTKKLLVEEGFDSNRILTLPNPVDPLTYFPEKKEIKYDLISVSNLTARKRVNLIIEAIAEVKIEFPNIKYAIIGLGPEKEKL